MFDFRWEMTFPIGTTEYLQCGTVQEDANWPTKPAHNSNLRTTDLFDQNSETVMSH